MRKRFSILRAIARPRPVRPRRAVLAGALLVASAGAARAHEVPATATVIAHVVADGDVVRVLMRAPLAAMRDIDFPLRGPGYLDLERAPSYLERAARLWIAGGLTLYADDEPLRGRVLAARASLPSDRSFGAAADALAHLRAPPLDPTTELPWRQALLDVLIEYRLPAGARELAIRPEWSHLGVRTTTLVRYRTRDGEEHLYAFTADPGLVRLAPGWHHAAVHFARLGFAHILDGIDHLLFLVLLVLPFRRVRPLVVIVTAFTVAHSLTLAASALDLAPGGLWFPPLIETLIAASIVFMALENILGPKLERRWAIAFAFGLVHGFGFSFALRESLQLAGGHALAALLAFNVGVELGQVAVVLVCVPLLELLFRRVGRERVLTILVSAIVAHTAWHWLAERWQVLRAHRIAPPALDLALLASALGWLLLAVIAAGAAWGLLALKDRLGATSPASRTS